MKKILLPALLCFALAACTATSSIKDYNSVKGNKADPVHGEETAMSYGALSGLGDVKANGVGYIRTYADGVSIVTVNLNIEQAPAGKTYTAKLENDDGSKALVIGELRSLIGDVRHAASVETKENTDDMKTISVYLGTDRIADGTMKAPAAAL